MSTPTSGKEGRRLGFEIAAREIESLIGGNSLAERYPDSGHPETIRTLRGLADRMWQAARLEPPQRDPLPEASGRR